MRRVTAGLFLAGLVALVQPRVALADQCTFCAAELEEGVNPLKCPNCLEIAGKIARGHESIWVLDFRPGDLARIQIKDETGDTETYWALPYTLTNRDEVPHSFFIDIAAYSDLSRHGHQRATAPEDYYTDRTGQPAAKLRASFRYHDVWIPDVYEEARRVLGVREGERLLSQRDVSMPPPGEGNRPPKLNDVDTKDTAHIALPMIQPGETLRCVALFETFDPEMDVLSVFVRGLTNSSMLDWQRDYARPAERPGERDVKEAILVLTYERPGDEFAPGLDPIRFVDRRWIDQPRTYKSDLESLPSDTAQEPQR